MSPTGVTQRGAQNNNNAYWQQPIMAVRMQPSSTLQSASEHNWYSVLAQKG